MHRHGVAATRALRFLWLGAFTALTMPAGAAGQVRFEQVVSPLTAEPMGASGVAWTDVDGDGFTDVAIAARDSMPNRVYRNVAGRFERIDLPLAWRDANAAAWGDIDGDGDPDLALGLQDGVALYETRLGGGGFELIPIDSAAGLTGPVRPRGGTDAIAFGDIDGDHDLDLVAAAYGTGGVSVLVNDGQGRFRMAGRDAFPFLGYLGGAHVGDLDGDGRADILTVGGPLPGFEVGTVIYWNRADGWRADRETTFAGHAGALGVSVADVDMDGDPDVFIAGWRPGTPSALYLNEGEGRFRRSRVAFPDRVVGSAFADLDGDGALDLVASTGYTEEGQMLVWSGDGAGGFRSVSVPGMTDVVGRFSGLAVVDVDRDGRLDVHVGSTVDAPRLFRNATSAGSWVQVELRATAGGVAVPGARVAASWTQGERKVTQTVSLAQQAGFGGHGEPVAHFAVPPGRKIDSVEIRWPGGVITGLGPPRLGTRHVVEAPPAPVRSEGG